MRVPDRFIGDLEAVRELAEATQSNWRIGGSLALYMHGRDREPSDLDVSLEWKLHIEIRIEQWGRDRGFLLHWVRGSENRLLVVHATVAPRHVIDIFIARETGDSPEGLDSTEIDGWPVSTLAECLISKEFWHANSQHWRKFEADIAWLRNKTKPPINGKHIMEVEYYTTDCLKRFYSKVAAKSPSGRFLEIGSFRGGSAIHLASTCGALGGSPVITCVDPWSDTPDEDTGFLYRDHVLSQDGDLMADFLRNIRDAKVDHVIIPVKGYSRDVATRWHDQSFDVVFIDGGHGYDTCLSDLRSYWPKVKPGGYLGCHDYWDDGKFEGVHRAVDEFSAEIGVPFEHDTITVFFRRGMSP